MNIRKRLLESAVFLLVAAVSIFTILLIVQGGEKKADCPVSLTMPLYTTEQTPSFSGDSAVSAALLDANSGALLYGKNENKRLPMASTTKIMTALVALDTLPLDRVIEIPKGAVGVEGSSIYLFEHEKITVENLLYGLMLESGNDAATALAIACAGDVESFADMMNSKAREIGLIDTHFTNPHGLENSEHYTTAYELAFLAATALKNPDFRRIVSTKSLAVKVCTGESSRYFVNHNRLLKSFDGAIGVKTGFTKSAGRCLVSAAQRNGETYVAVTLNDGNDWKDHTSMLDFAFENFDSVEIAAPNSFKLCRGGKIYSNPDGIYLTVSKDRVPEISYNAELSETTGQVNYSIDGQKMGSFGLISENSEQK